MLPSERVVIESPMSLSGSAKRLWHITRRWPVLTVPIAIMLIVVAWTLVLSWYCLFGLLVVPWRLLRRGQRREKRDRLRHQELLR